MFYRIIGILLLATACFPGKAQTPPNIVFILADDLGYKDCGFTGSTVFKTPVIDGLARKGLVFTQAYAAAGNCAPSRACLMSGLYTPRHGVYAVGSTVRGPKDRMRLLPVPNTTSLRPDIITMAEALQVKGYATGLFGKWHLGKGTDTGPLAQGFDAYTDTRLPNPNKKRSEPEDPKGIFSLTNAALDFISEKKQQPFFVFLSHHAIHTAQEARPSSIRQFRKQGLNERQALYAACIYDLDASIGKVMHYLDTAGLASNTLVIFTSDNGATQESSQEPLRGNKGCYYEGGIREPFIAYWPGKIKPGVNLTPVINIDLYPTFLEVAGGVAPKRDGESLLPLLLGKAAGTRRSSLFWHFPGYLDKPVIRGRDTLFRSRPATVIRKGDWKLHLYYEEWLLDGGTASVDRNNAVELYNLKTDEGERHNIASRNKTKRDELLNDLLQWLEQTKAPLPQQLKDRRQLDQKEADATE
ncbi:sulfatase [Niabella beijingensis]|uniref:sulfatase n=1 Tax=Niabella beijingensis TaxID=2872700 RepID=UPI001CBB3C77|nr:sulfatase [Niabella beijingensis]MBZ4188025.1 sulfatase [Niabella beijingensis]